MLALTLALRRFAAALAAPIALVSGLSKVRSSDPEGRKIYVEFVRTPYPVRAFPSQREALPWLYARLGAQSHAPLA